MTSYQILPSLLSADFARLGDEAQAVMQAGANGLHLDVMDNHYVPNLTVGPMVCQALREHGIQAMIDVHLMTRPVDALITAFAKAGASRISFHPEATHHIDRSLALIRSFNCAVGLALNPATSLDVLEYISHQLDFIVIMSVNPGFSGQSFIPTILNKIRQARAHIQASGRNIQLVVDGGVTVSNIQDIAKAGANAFVAGSAIFNHPPYQATIQKMRTLLETL